MEVAVLSDASVRSRALAAALEPVVGSVYFSPEAHDAYAELGFGPSPGSVSGDEWSVSHWGGVMLPDGIAYFASRGAILGQVRGEVVAAAFGVFNRAVVVPAVSRAWQIADADAVVAARTRGAIAQLERILGHEPDDIERVIELLAQAAATLTPAGRPMFAGLLALPIPTSSVGRMWRLADELREYRGDAHIAAWTGAGFDGCELQMLTERCAGMPPRTYVVTRGWDSAQLDAAEARLNARGLLDGETASEAGRAAREAVEAETDRLCLAMIDALGVDVMDLVAVLQRWGSAIRAANGYYPSSPQEAILSPRVQQWMLDHGLPAFSGAPA
jgi:hypothetical protein